MLQKRLEVPDTTNFGDAGESGIQNLRTNLHNKHASSGEPILLYATYTPLFFSITYTDIFARIRAKFHTYTSRKSTYNIPTYNYLVIAYIQRIVVAYSCNVYMSKTTYSCNVFVQLKHVYVLCKDSIYVHETSVFSNVYWTAYARIRDLS